jgi:E3 ubiquitin-protein ligase SHPRH
VYEGWKKLQDGIRRQQASQNKSNGAKPGDKKRKATEALRKKVVKKYSNGKGKVDGEDDEEGGAEHADEPVKEEASA